jgi:glycogen debranching enzyme
MSDNRITVPQVFKVLGIEPTPAQAWSVGSRMAAQYQEAFGIQPPKDNRPKTNGHGSHCFALYPPNWRKRIEAEIRLVVDMDKRQAALFDEQ